MDPSWAKRFFFQRKANIYTPPRFLAEKFPVKIIVHIFTKVISNSCSVLVANKSTLEAKIPLEMLNYIWMNFGTKEIFRKATVDEKITEMRGMMLNENNLYYTKNRDIFPAIHRPILKQFLKKKTEGPIPIDQEDSHMELKRFKMDTNFNR
jgi:hypothetical protein